MVEKPKEYPWSTYRAKVGLVDSEAIDTDPCYQALGRTQDERASSYRAWVCDAISEGEWDQIRAAVLRGQLTGTYVSLSDLRNLQKFWIVPQLQI